MSVTVNEFISNLSLSLLKSQAKIMENIKQIKKTKRILFFNTPVQEQYTSVLQKEFPNLEMYFTSDIEEVNNYNKKCFFDIILLNLSLNDERYLEQILNRITSEKILIVLNHMENEIFDNFKINKKIIKKYNGSSTCDDWYKDIQIYLRGGVL